MLEQVEKAVLRHPLTAMPNADVCPDASERAQVDAPYDSFGGERELKEGASDDESLGKAAAGGART
jgi:hypothetical protein